MAAAPTPRTWPVLGSSLWVFGVSMWAFLVMGQLTTSYGPGKRDLLVSEGLAAMFVLAAGIGTWVVSLRRMIAASPTRGIGYNFARSVAAAFLAFLTWCVVTVAATIMGEASRKNADGKITVLLLVLAGASIFGGRWLAGVRGSAGTSRARSARLVGWIGAAVLTLVALIEVAVTD
jgi:hypothetical protein